MSFGATHAARETPHPRGTLLADACLSRDTSSAPQACSRLWSHISICCRMHAHAAFYTSLLFAGCSRRSSTVQRRRRAPTAGASTRWRFRPMARRSCPHAIAGRSKSGILVRRSPQIAPPWPKLTLAGLSGRHDGAVEREDQRPQPLGHVGCVFPRWDQDRVRIVRQDDQSLGFWCA